MATLSQNISQAISDFDDIKTAIIAKGVSVPAGTPTSDYDDLIGDIPSGDDSKLMAVIERSSTPMSLNISDGVTKIGDYAFYGFEGLTSVTIPDSVTSIGQFAFYLTSLTSINVSNNVTRMGNSAFRSCQQMITASVNSQSIGELAFNLCSNLTTLTLGNNVMQLGDKMAYSCVNLTTVTIPNSIRVIQVNNGTTFGLCSKLEYVTIENGFNANNLHLENSTKYSASTIVSWLNALADRTGQTTYTLTIGQTNLDKLTAEQIAIATNKNWNLA